VRKLLSMQMRYEHGERDVWRVVHVPSVEAEDGYFFQSPKYAPQAYLRLWARIPHYERSQVA
jgi:hypothetical protein